MKRMLILLLTLALSLLPGVMPAALADGETTCVIRYTLQQYGAQPDYIDLDITVYDAGGEIVFQSAEARTEPLWEEKQAPAITFSEMPDRVVFSCRYRREDTQEYWPVTCTVPFQECEQFAAQATDWSGSSFTLLICSITDSTVTYRDVNGAIRKRPDADLFTGKSTLTTGWYYGLSPYLRTERLEISGDVNLILPDGMKFTIRGGIRLPAGSSLTIWGQANGTGSLYCDATDEDDCAGIGGNDEESAGTFTLNGGRVTALGGEFAAGLGGGQYGYGGKVVVNRGYLYAEGGNVNTDLYVSGAGIGGGEDRGGGDVTINGGTVIARAGTDGAGIGGGAGGSQRGTITINGGTVDAEAYYGAAIGGGKYDGGGGNGGTVIINGGTVNATSYCGACIGGGYEGTNGDITINNGTVNAIGGGAGSAGAAAIGAGWSKAQGGTITINGGVIEAESKGYGAGIGGGSGANLREGYDGGTIRITNGIVTATSLHGAGIGGGGSKAGGGGGDGGNISISGGVVCAASKYKGAGIGGGNDGDGGTIRISGGMVVAVGGYLDYSYIKANGKASGSAKSAAKGLSGAIPYAMKPLDEYAMGKIADFFLSLIFSGEYGGAGIGGGDDGNGGTVIITGGSVYAGAGRSTARAIGRGDGGSSDGSVKVYNEAMVAAGSDKDNVKPVSSDQRESACKSNVYAEIVPCDHSEGLLTDNGWENHWLKCSWCVGTEAVRQPHVFDEETHRCACGHGHYLVSVHAVGGVRAEAVDPMTAEPAERIPGGAPVWLYVYPDQDGNYPEEVRGEYVYSEQPHTLDPNEVIQEDGRMKYVYNGMPSADVTIIAGMGIRTWADLQTAMGQAAPGQVLQIAADLRAGENDTALTVAGDQELTINLNGFTLDRGLFTESGGHSEYDGTVFHIAGKLTIMDSAGGGRITGGYDRDGAGGVYLTSGGTLTLLGGAVTGNCPSGKNMPGGIYVPEGATLRVGGSASVTGNVGPNVMLVGDNTRMEIIEALTEDARFGMTCRHIAEEEGARRTVTAGLAGRGQASAFFSDRSEYLIVSDENGEAVLVRGAVVSFAAGYEDPDESMASVTVPLNTDYELPDCLFSAPAGRMFMGWQAGGEMRQPGEAFTVTGDVTVTAAWGILEPTIAYNRLRLTGVLGLKYYVELPADFDETGATITFKMPYRADQCFAISAGTPDSETGCRVFECAVYAYQMADPITAVIAYQRNGREKTVTDVYSVGDYLESIQEGDYTASEKNLVHAAQAYGHYIQPYLARINGWAYGEKYAVLQYEGTADISAAVSGSEAYAHTLTTLDRDVIESVRYKLTLNADTAMNLEIILKEAPAETVTVKVDGTETTPEVSGKTYRVKIGGIAANNLDVAKNVVLETGGKTALDLTVSPLSYVRMVLSDENGEADERDALAALYAYWQAAENCTSGQ